MRRQKGNGGRGLAYAWAYVKAQGYHVGLDAVRNAFERFDREERRRRLGLVPLWQKKVRTDIESSVGAALIQLMSGHWRAPTNTGGYVSRPQVRMQRLLEDAGYRVLPEHPLGHYRVDCYLPDQNIAFECDGVYWHGGQKAQAKDKRRDAILLRRYGITTIRLTDVEINTWPAPPARRELPRKR